MFGWLRLEDFGFPLEPSQPIKVSGKRLGQDLQRDWCGIVTKDERIKRRFQRPGIREKRARCRTDVRDRGVR